jgi:hypothetical protein
MKQNTTRKSKLGSYSALAGSMLAVAGSASAQIKHSNVNPDSVLSFGEMMSIDLDTNGTPDFNFSVVQFTSTSSSSFSVNVAMVSVIGNPNNAIIGSLYSGYPFPTALNGGDSIKANSAWNDQAVNNGNQYMGVFYSPNSYGNFPNTVNKFVGVRFSNGSQTFYGWIRLSLSATSNMMTINDYAYQTNGNGLIAGQADFAGVEDLIAGNVNIHSFEKTVYIHVKDIQAVQGNVVVANMLGETVHTCELRQSAQQVDLSFLTTGMYFVTVNLGDRSLMKKVYIY